RPHESDPRLELVHGAVRLDARVGFRHARAVEERRVTGVAGLGVELQKRLPESSSAAERLRESFLPALTPHNMPRASGSRRPPVVPPTTAQLVSPAWPRPAVAKDA